MKIIKIELLLKNGPFPASSEFKDILDEITKAISAVTHPEGSGEFILNPTKKGSGVLPIKKNFIQSLIGSDWLPEHRMSIASRIKPGPIDAVKKLSDGRYFSVEWETGNISSSHRALNKMAVGLLDGVLAGGILVLPSRDMYRYLTDRVGNFAEIEPYFPVWKNLRIREGILGVIEIEHEALSTDVPTIKKGTDGRALR
jgi:hypothetical protein